MKWKCNSTRMYIETDDICFLEGEKYTEVYKPENWRFDSIVLFNEFGMEHIITGDWLKYFERVER